MKTSAKKKSSKSATPKAKGDTNELLHHIIANMATKDELTAVKEELKAEIQELRDHVADIKTDVAYIKAELTDIRADLKNIKGFKTEVDYAFERIANIEKHLGINPSAKVR